MLFFLPTFLRGAIAGLLLLLNIIIMSFLVIVAGVFSMIMPFRQIKKAFTTIQNDIVTSLWSDFNYLIIKLVSKTQIEVQGQAPLDYNSWYFVIANHCSWADILILQHVFNRKIRLLKFFMKQELLWSLPMGGLACWMLGYPFMKRYSKGYLKKHPEKKGADLEAAKTACRLFENRPTTVINFLEATRFTPEKQKARSSPYKHLLRPKVGGAALVLNELQSRIKELINVTLIYSDPNPSFWRFMSGQIKKITVHYTVLPLGEENFGDYYHNGAFRKNFQAWINRLWQQKDEMIEIALSKNSS